MTPEQPAPPDLRPLGIGETIDAALRLLRRRFGLYVKLAIAFLLPPAILIGAYMASEVVMVRNGTIYVNDPNAYRASVLALGLLARLLQLACFGVLVHLSARLYMNRHENAGSILKASRRRLIPFIGLILLLGVIAFGFLIGASVIAAVILVVPSTEVRLIAAVIPPIGWLVVAIALVLWVTRFSLAAPAFWYEEIGANAAIKRSTGLVKNRFWKVLGSLSVGIAIIAVFTIGLGALLVSAILNVTTPVLYVAVNIGVELLGDVIGLIVLAPVVTVVYFDARVRNEGFDMQVKLDASREDEPPPSVPW